jgi:hypothetical protein
LNALWPGFKHASLGHRHSIAQTHDIFKKLDQAHIQSALASHRKEVIRVFVTVPGERWEVEFLGDGSVEIERFPSTGEICGEEALHKLLNKYADPEHAETV